ncbi:MAG: bifunctional phosphoribosylaminoimidazolecarboxamide formyltransferase/IMP cyclohydrolase PurH [Candidatus Marinimicrobia bacterium]|nr:bifunctional phosphoribosylaminoimidazolecarboxamide formyltransferase/IMP cyclohydrolase PurH [Candidatus Neomarinimicrobiota bacterium]
MLKNKKIKNVLVSVFNKDGLLSVIKKLDKHGVNIYSTGGTQQYIKNNNIKVTKVEDLTSYPSILGGRVKTLHPKIFGGILARRDVEEDKDQLTKYVIPEFDLVIVDLYPFEKTVQIPNVTENEIIEKIDIGGISLIRAAAKNFKDVLVVSEISQYNQLLDIIKEDCSSSLKDRQKFAINAFKISSNYDTNIFNYFSDNSNDIFVQNINKKYDLRYGENPHQEGIFFGNLEDFLTKLNGKDLSYNNLLDIDAAINLISEFDELTFAILKHNNACGVASRDNLLDAWKSALEADPISAFGGVLITNHEINLETAVEIDKLFYEVLIAPSFAKDALELLTQKKNRVILLQKNVLLPKKQFRTILNGVLQQEKDLKTDSTDDMKTVTKISPTKQEKIDLVFASKICKHTKSNTIVFAKNKQLISSGVGQTSRVDALNQAVKKAISFKFNLNGAVMASDAFFPFPDCVSLANEAGVTSVIQPGGSIKDHLSIEYCDKHKMSMVMTGIRHFKH